MQLYPSFTASVVLVLGLTGTMQPPLASGPAAGPCALITRDEAAEAWGGPVPAGVERVMTMPLAGRSVTVTYCMYGSVVTVWQTPLGSGAPGLFTQLRQADRDDKDDYVNLTGFGDEAYYATGNLNIRKGETELTVGIAQKTGYGPHEFEVAKRLAILALSRF